MEWTWDPEKNQENIGKHGFRFETAVLVFIASDNETREDDYEYEERWQTIGTIHGELVLVIHTWPDREGNPGRIISARKPSRSEMNRYQEGIW